MSRWSLNILKQYVADRVEQEDCVTSIAGNSTEIHMAQTSQVSTKSWACNEWGIDQEFPSLEDMFSGNVIRIALNNY